MFQKVLEYAGEYRKTTYLSMAVMLIGIVMNVLPFLFIYQLIRPLLLGESLELGYAAWRVAAIAVCGILYAVLYVKGLSLSHRAAYNTLKNLRYEGDRAGVPTLRGNFGMEELGRACGMRAGVLAITDKGFAKAVKELAEAVTEEKEEHAHDD